MVAPEHAAHVAKMVAADDARKAAADAEIMAEQDAEAAAQAEVFVGGRQWSRRLGPG